MARCHRVLARPGRDGPTRRAGRGAFGPPPGHRATLRPARRTGRSEPGAARLAGRASAGRGRGRGHHSDHRRFPGPPARPRRLRPRHSNFMGTLPASVTVAPCPRVRSPAAGRPGAGRPPPIGRGRVSDS
eukprot:231782-Hanusia_phi.AAC.2